MCKSWSWPHPKHTVLSPLPAGDYDFPFEIPLREILLETVTGPGHNYRTYRLDAIVERTYWKDTIVSQPLRIYNAPDTEWNDINSWYPLVCVGIRVVEIC